MRRILAAAAAALIACSLAACSGRAAGTGGASTTAAAGAGAVPATALEGRDWTVRDAHGAASGTRLRFDEGSITLLSAEGATSSTYAWATQGDDVLVSAGTLSLGGGAAAAWLVRTTRAVPAGGGGWILLDASGATTARLDAAGSAPTASPAPTATAGPGVVDVPAARLGGRWTVAGHPEAAVTFDAGRWRTVATCTVAAAGGTGAYRVLPGGRLLLTRTGSLVFGCPIGRDEQRVPAPAITGIGRATSFRIQGSTLTLFDRTGAAIGSLTRR